MTAHTLSMSQSLKLMVTMDRVVSALVCEDHMLQGLLWTSEMTILGDEIFKIYQDLFVKWNEEDKENRSWEAKVFSRDGWFDSQYIIELIHFSDGKPTHKCSVIVKKYVGTLMIEFVGHTNYTTGSNASSFNTLDANGKKDF